jgi:uncharacterized protein (TIGR00299 family) protein
MAKLAYLDCQTGIAGDMCLGALVAAGVPLEYLSERLQGLGIDNEYRLWAESVHRNGQLATKVHVELLEETPQHHHHSPARHLPEIERLIEAAGLPPQASQWSLAVFRQLAEAEGAVHGIAPDKVHFHEVGATDALVDIVGTCLGLDWLGIEQLYCSPLPTGGGTIRSAHGQLPVPVPAVLKLWESRQVPIYSNGIERELVTPTGAALAVTLATEFGSPPAMHLQRIGLGAGSRQLPLPNILRLWIGEGAGEQGSRGAGEQGSRGAGEQGRRGAGEQGSRGAGEQGSKNQSKIQNPKSKIPHAPCPMPNSQFPNSQTITVLETQIDDLNPQAIGYVFEALFAVGALDVFTQGIGMKKSRPGILLTAICLPEKAAACEAVLFRETSTLGIRHRTQQRTILPREIQQVQTDYGVVRVKVASWDGLGAESMVNVQPEYEDCAALAREHHLPWREVHRQALEAWYRH